jgi:hypothetical protein
MPININPTSTPSQISTIETIVRQRLVEITPRFWTSDELTTMIIAGIKDLWREVVDLKQEYYLTVDNVNVSYPQGSNMLAGVPTNVHKIYMIEPVDLTLNGTNHGLEFKPLEYNKELFKAARGIDAIDPSNGVIWYATHSQGAPVGAPVIRCAPQVTSTVYLSFCYVPTIDTLLSSSDFVPIPGEADNALVAWTVAYAKGKETPTGAPDPSWLAIYATEKTNLLESLGLRNYQEPEYVDAEFEDYWG